MTERLIYLILAVGGLGAAGVWISVTAVRGHSIAWAVAALLLLVSSAAGLLLLTRAVLLIERGKRS